MKDNYDRPPFWYIGIIMLMAVPLFFWPLIMGGGLTDAAISAPDGKSFLVDRQFFSIGFPIFAVLALYLSYRTFRQRRAISIILLCILALSYIAVPWVL